MQCSDPLRNAACVQAWRLHGTALHSLCFMQSCSKGIRTSAEETCQGTCQGAFPKKGKLTAPRAVYSPTSSAITDRTCFDWHLGLMLIHHT